mmetsp:Transcript_4561/g.7285  ORF Transcript_4561/g.7285 Transcript_4561/m.7285 type:complete len:529 (-) Transcript_4561:107-1693(-)
MGCSMGCYTSKQDVTPIVPGPKVLDSKEVSDKTSKAAEPVKRKQEDIRDNYELGEILGSGSFGQVRHAFLKADPTQVSAVKVIERDNSDGEWSDQATFLREVEMLQQINNENIIRYYDFYEDVHFLYVVMELCKGGEVFAKIIELKRFGEKNAAFMGKQMLGAIAYIHSIKITHRDIKAENFMLSEPSISSPVKMIDFGMACRFEEDDCMTELCGSPHYLAPELIGQNYTYRADIWAFGVLLYLLMYGHYPYDAKHPRDIMVKILTEPIRWQTKAMLSSSGLDFLKQALEHSPRRRITVAEALKHPWIEIGSAKLTETDDCLPKEVIRSAHKKVTASRKPVDPKVEEYRNEKLRQIDADWKKGIKHGQRLGETTKEAYMSRPEFVRRANRLSTAPSRQGLTEKDMSMDVSISVPSVKEISFEEAVAQVRAQVSQGHIVQQPAVSSRPSGGSIVDGSQAAARQKFDRPRSRTHMTDARRLSYIGKLSDKEERNLVALFQEKHFKESAASGAGGHNADINLPGSAPILLS